MAKANEVAKMLRTLPSGEYRIIDIIKIIIQSDQHLKEGLFDNSPFGRKPKDWDDTFYSDEITKELKELFPNGLEDLWVDLSYQRVIKLTKIIAHLRRKDMHDKTLGFDKMLCGSVDITVRPNGRGFVWDGFRRCIIALLHGKRFIKTSIEHHDLSWSIQQCREKEAYVFSVKNGEAESMPKEELFKSGCIWKKPEALKVHKVLVDMGADVLGTNPGNPELGAFSEFQDTVLKEKLTKTDYLVQACYKQQKSWPTASSLTGYLTCGLALFLDTLEKEDEDGNLLCPSIEIHTAHPNTEGTCDVEKKLVKYAGRYLNENGEIVYHHKQTDLCRNRLAGMSVESVAFNIGRLVMGFSNSQLFELLEALGFESDSEIMHQMTLLPTNKALAA